MKRRTTGPAGFTLVEVLISASLAAVIMTSVLSTYLFIGRNLARLASYEALETESRRTLAYLCKDFAQAERVKAGTTPTTAGVTLELPAGEVTYSYDGTAQSLRRQANFGSGRDLTFLHNDSCACTTFSFKFFTLADGAPTDQTAPTANVPFSIKQIQVGYVVESPSSWSTLPRTLY